jgi:thymidylate synthase ThyX
MLHARAWLDNSTRFVWGCTNKARTLKNAETAYVCIRWHVHVKQEMQLNNSSSAVISIDSSKKLSTASMYVYPYLFDMFSTCQQLRKKGRDFLLKFVADVHFPIFSKLTFHFKQSVSFLKQYFFLRWPSGLPDGIFSN